MQDKKQMIIYKENIFDKIKNLFTNIFNLKKKEILLEESAILDNYIGKSRENFNKYISFKEDKNELAIINKVRANTDILKNMSMEELDRVGEAILNRTQFVDRKISKLKTDLMMKQNEYTIRRKRWN